MSSDRDQSPGCVDPVVTTASSRPSAYSHAGHDCQHRWHTTGCLVQMFCSRGQPCGYSRIDLSGEGGAGLVVGRVDGYEFPGALARSVCCAQRFKESKVTGDLERRTTGDKHRQCAGQDLLSGQRCTRNMEFPALFSLHTVVRHDVKPLVICLAVPSLTGS
jgi:hypothetical protein